MTRNKGIAAVGMAVWVAACAQSDAGITTAIKAQLAADEQVKAYQINVDTNDKTVTLNGKVDTAAAKTRAANIARTQKGVVHVIDNITVIAAEPNPISDDALTNAVKAQLLTNSAVAGLRIEVTTLNGVVTLTGDVRSPAEKDILIQLARDTAGVRDVRDRLVVRARR
jgi:hyperosmotically inducible periplasmic protein